jgi:phage terminase large subunit-like protein
MVAFAFLGNTLFLTILVSMLSNTFSNISTNASAEIQFRRAVRTLEGVKADAIFAYQPPFNLLAVFIFLPLKFVVSPRWFHKIHVATVRLVNLPLLLIIAMAERRLIHSADGDVTNPVIKKWFWQKWQLSTSKYMRSVFDEPPPEDVHDDIAVDDEMTHHLIRRQFTRTNTADALTLSRQQQKQKKKQQQQQQQQKKKNNEPPEQRKPSRRDSMFPGVRTKLRRSFTEDEEDYDAMSKKLQGMEKSMNRMEAMLAQLVPDTQVPDMEESAVDDYDEAGGVESMEESVTLQETQGLASESPYRGP